MFTEIDTQLLADAFPASMAVDALKAGTIAHSILHQRQWANRQRLVVGGEHIYIPRRLHFVEHSLGGETGRVVNQMVACLQTQSTDGFHRQRALQPILQHVQPWSAPFVVALIGEYIVEIISDICASLTPNNMSELLDFITENPAYWEVTKQRVGSYWNAYYRRKYTKRDYPGFVLVNEIEGELRSRRK